MGPSSSNSLRNGFGFDASVSSLIDNIIYKANNKVDTINADDEISESFLIDTSPWRSRFDFVYGEIRRRIVLLDYLPESKLDIKNISGEGVNMGDPKLGKR